MLFSTVLVPVFLALQFEIAFASPARSLSISIDIVDDAPLPHRSQRGVLNGKDNAWPQGVSGKYWTRPDAIARPRLERQKKQQAKKVYKSFSDREEAPFDYIPTGPVDPEAEYGGVQLTSGSIINLAEEFPEIKETFGHRHAWASPANKTSLELIFTLTTANAINITYGFVVNGTLRAINGTVTAALAGKPKNSSKVNSTSKAGEWISTGEGFADVNATLSTTIDVVSVEGVNVTKTASEGGLASWGMGRDVERLGGVFNGTVGYLVVLSYEFDFVFDFASESEDDIEDTYRLDL